MPPCEILADIFTSLEVSEEPLKYQPVFQKKAPDNVFIIKSQNLKTRGKNLGGTK